MCRCDVDMCKKVVYINWPSFLYRGTIEGRSSLDAVDLLRLVGSKVVSQAATVPRGKLGCLARVEAGKVIWSNNDWYFLLGAMNFYEFCLKDVFSMLLAIRDGFFTFDEGSEKTTFILFREDLLSPIIPLCG